VEGTVTLLGKLPFIDLAKQRGVNTDTAMGDSSTQNKNKNKRARESRKESTTSRSRSRRSPVATSVAPAQDTGTDKVSVDRNNVTSKPRSRKKAAAMHTDGSSDALP
jgi:hypothetical protein